MSGRAVTGGQQIPQPPADPAAERGFRELLSRLDGKLDVAGGVRRIADGETTPNVDPVRHAGAWHFVTANTGATTITDLRGGREGMMVVIKFGDANTTVDFTGTDLKGNGGADWSPGDGDFMVCHHVEGEWLCNVVNT